MPKRSSSSSGVVLRFAVLSRLLILILTAVARLLFDPYDTSAPLNPPCLSGGSQPSDPPIWPRVGAAIEAGVVWDGVYFVRVAECGAYEYEQSYAFLPLLPAALRLLSRSLFAPLVPIVGWRAALAVSGYVLNNVAFVLAAMYFYKLSLLILNEEEVALHASILFCFNPASIFYSSIYSESLYALFSLGGMYYLFSGANTRAMLLLALSGSARSNGAVNAGYFCFQALHHACDAIMKKKRSKAFQAIATGVACSICIFVPFVAFQAYGYFTICRSGVLEELRPWCKAKIPHLYGFLQSHYWGVGFLRYFQVKQLPNFLLASPILSLAVCSIIQYASLLPKVVKSMHEEKGIAAVQHTQGSAECSNAAHILENSYSRSFEGDTMVRRRKQENKEKVSASSEDLKLQHEASLQTKQGYHSIRVLPFVLHLGFMTFTAFFVMHVQVATRFLSASPSIYWYASYTLASPGKASRRLGYIIWAYFIAYILLGSLLFSNFYPFT